ncbi:MAG TPA: type II toxin-antitoxin system PemK/MazF family toxin [Solirubrobacterales bacterium]|nr:type II toxin-antitoxin system PemK/MazF family toxin [Solirubrobacterales bacterium]
MKTEVEAKPPQRGDLYLTDPGPGPPVGREQSGRRPYLVLSIAPMNRSPLRVVIAVPLTTTDWTNPLHVRVDPAESGLPRVSYAMPEMVRSVSTLCFERRMGRVPLETVEVAAANTGFLVGLGRTRF